MEYSNFDLGLQGSIFFIISCALHENCGCICLLEYACTSLTIPSPLNKHEMWRYSVPVLLVLFFLLSASFLSHFCTFFCFFLSGDPPRLFFLDKFDIAGVGACLKRYTDPSFFKAESASSWAVKLQVQKGKKICKEMRKAIPNPVLLQLTTLGNGKRTRVGVA